MPSLWRSGVNSYSVICAWSWTSWFRLCPSSLPAPPRKPCCSFCLSARTPRRLTKREANRPAPECPPGSQNWAVARTGNPGTLNHRVGTFDLSSVRPKDLRFTMDPVPENGGARERDGRMHPCFQRCWYMLPCDFHGRKSSSLLIPGWLNDHSERLTGSKTVIDGRWVLHNFIEFCGEMLLIIVPTADFFHRFSFLLRQKRNLFLLYKFFKLHWTLYCGAKWKSSCPVPCSNTVSRTHPFVSAKLWLFRSVRHQQCNFI